MTFQLHGERMYKGLLASQVQSGYS